MNSTAAAAIAGWRYAGALALYNGSPDDIPALLDPANHYYVASSCREGLVGFCCFGPDARVPGGAYADGPLDLGFGLRPNLLGLGWGALLVRSALRFARIAFGPAALRATVAEFNERSLDTCRRAGFREVARFSRPADGLPFVVLQWADPATPPMSPR